jgi:hypothetical protein
LTRAAIRPSPINLRMAFSSHEQSPYNLFIGVFERSQKQEQYRNPRTNWMRKEIQKLG